MESAAEALEQGLAPLSSQQPETAKAGMQLAERLQGLLRRAHAQFDEVQRAEHAAEAVRSHPRGGSSTGSGGGYPEVSAAQASASRAMESLCKEQRQGLAAIRLEAEQMLQWEHDAAVRQRLWGLAAAVAKAQASVRPSVPSHGAMQPGTGAKLGPGSPERASERWSRLPSPSPDDEGGMVARSRASLHGSRLSSPE